MIIHHPTLKAPHPVEQQLKTPVRYASGRRGRLTKTKGIDPTHVAGIPMRPWCLGGVVMGGYPLRFPWQNLQVSAPRQQIGEQPHDSNLLFSPVLHNNTCHIPRRNSSDLANAAHREDSVWPKVRRQKSSVSEIFGTRGDPGIFCWTQPNVREINPWHHILFINPPKGCLCSTKTSWWFQPIWKILVKMGIFPK